MGGCWPQMVRRPARVVSVWSHSFTPRMRLNTAHMTTSQEWALSQVREVGRRRAGREKRVVTNIRIALARRACMGKWLISTNLATELMVGALFISFIQRTVAIAIMIPEPRKRASVTRKEILTPEGIVEGVCLGFSVSLFSFLLRDVVLLIPLLFAFSWVAR